MKHIFDMNPSDLRKLQKFMKNSPREFRAATAGVLNNLAFTTRQYDIKNIQQSMIVRSPGFINTSLKYQKTKITNIQKQYSMAYSITRKNFSGWTEQEYGTRTKLNRKITTTARRGNRRNKVYKQARLSPSNQPYKPEQFAGNTLKQKYMFMMRVIASRGGGEFIISNPIPTTRGQLGRGLYGLYKGRINKLQIFDKDTQPKRNQWRTMSIQQLKYRNDMAKIWREQIKRIIRKSK